ncbi:hypothetical protein K1T73_00390 [Roseovarius sp. SCSIO 43702]|uniref:hypothetical protein n=1 Tax=Roseovarius sp. SCSIO 43702 TaxID=2823043 RepID=UPI001C738A59|nr:hypothetical protein [Roseovarius sp. SCSIO 43702]QYX56914.1 hypothetical protein K1T73_00390 [Roseovarius sp. SCSIO 43702]
MKPYVILALTTFHDLNSDGFGADLYSLISQIEPRLLPQRAGWLGTLSASVTSIEDFAALWRNDRQIYTSQGRCGKRESTGINMGVEWTRRSAIKNKGKIIHRGIKFSNQAEALVLHSEWRARVDWLELFRRLCLLTKAAHGMLHLYCPDETSGFGPDKRSLYQREGIHGQQAFTYSIDPYGIRRPPGPGDPNLKTFRQLPELTWATWLGSNFDGQYDRRSLKDMVVNTAETQDGFLFTITDQLGDIMDDFVSFRNRRDAVKASGFPETFFQTD